MGLVECTILPTHLY